MWPRFTSLQKIILWLSLISCSLHKTRIQFHLPEDFGQNYWGETSLNLGWGHGTNSKPERKQRSLVCVTWERAHHRKLRREHITSRHFNVQVKKKWLNCVWLLPVTPRILFINKLLTTTFNFDSKLSVDEAKMLNSYSGQKAYRFWLIKCNSAGIFPCMNQNLPKLLLTQLQSRGQQPFSPDPSILPKGPAASCPFSCWSGSRQPSPRDGGLILQFLTWISPALRQRKEGSINAQGSWNPSLPVI